MIFYGDTQHSGQSEKRNLKIPKIEPTEYSDETIVFSIDQTLTT
jgi:hypothetical protein